MTVQAASADLKAIAAQLALAVSGFEQGAECKRRSVVRTCRGQAAADFVDAACRGRAAAADCLRECGQPGAGASGKPAGVKQQCAALSAPLPARLVRQFITEGLLLAGLGCAAGMLAGVVMMSVLTRIVPKPMAQGMPFLAAVGLNPHTALFAAEPRFWRRFCWQPHLLCGSLSERYKQG